jgi:O-antigen/teichoic acid export membrane protein
MRMNSLLVNAGMNGTAQGLGKLVRFVVTSIAILRFGSASWGEVVFALTLVTYLNFVLDFGLSSLALIEHPDDEKMDRKLFVAMGYTRGIVLLLLAAIGAGVYFAMDLSGGFVLKAYLLQVFLRPANLDWWLSRKGYAGINPVVQFFRQCAVLGVMWFANLSTIEHFALLDVGSEAVATAALWLLGPKRKFSVLPPRAAEWKSSLGCYRSSFVLFFSSSLLLLHQNVDIFFLKFFCGNSAVGVYDYCFRYAMFVFVLGSALSIPLRRQLARLREFGQHENSAALVQSSHKVLGVMSALFLLGTLAFSEKFFTLVIPLDADLPASKVMVLFAGWLVVSFYSVPWSEWLISTSRKDYLKLAIVAGIVNVISNVSLVPEFGVLGAAMAKICSETGIFIFLLTRVTKVMRKQFCKVIVIHMLLVPCVAYFWITGGIPWWGLAATAAALLVVVGVFRYVSRDDLKVLARN